MANEEKRGGSGNFSQDRERASEAGKKGGERSHQGGRQQESESRQGGKQQGGGSREGMQDNQSDQKKKDW